MTLTEKDQHYIWHPYTQMQNALPIIPIVSGKGATLIAEDGKTYIDAVASWWTNLHGHGHPFIAERIAQQAKQLEHVIFAGFTHQPAVDLAEKLITALPNNQKKVFYSDNGSTAVEVALKMVFQYWYNHKQAKKIIIAFENAYHGDTFGAMAVSGRSTFTKPFENFLFDVKTIPVPVNGKEQISIAALNAIIGGHKENIAGFIFEPLIQGTAGMIMYSAEALDQLLDICKANTIFTIADEVMTGFGRTGKLFASDYLKNKPDIFCLSKGITGGFLPFGVTTCSVTIYDAFLSSDKSKTFFHGHSYTANPIVCAAALANLELFEKENTLEKVKQIQAQHEAFIPTVIDNDRVLDIRVLGSILALEIKVADASYFSELRDYIYNYFLEWGILLRPLGNTVYILPPYCISKAELDYIYHHIRLLLIQLEK
jgi:adenosylmethionine---8-amino-7-oxononanoate aminotransferase